MKRDYKHSFDKISFSNRWTNKYPPDDWVIIGIQQWWFSPQRYEYRICFFGFNLRIWIKRELKKNV